MPTKNRRASIVARANQARHCDVPGCGQNRYSLSRWCCRHAAAAERAGDPQAHSIRSTNWAGYRGLVRLIYTQNAEHQGLKTATAWLASWMQQAVAEDGRQAWATEVARLQRHGCTPLDVLVELASVWVYLQTNPRATRSDAHRDFTVSKAVLGLAPRPRRQTTRPGASGSYAIKSKPAALRHVGPHLVRTLSALLVNTHASIQTQGDRARAEVAAFRVPFNPTPLALAQAAQATTND